MLDLKGIGYRLVHVLPGNQRMHLRLAGFRHGTVPALKLDGRRIQGSTRIARAVDQLRPDPPLYPADPDARLRVESAEHWGDATFQMVPRRILRLGMARDSELRTWLGETDGSLPFASIASRATAPIARYYARVVAADPEHVRQSIAELPAMLDQVDRLFADGTLSQEPPNAATLQILSTVRSLLGFGDFEEQVSARAYAPLARKLFPHFPEAIVPPFVERLGLA